MNKIQLKTILELYSDDGELHYDYVEETDSYWNSKDIKKYIVGIIENGKPTNTVIISKFDGTENESVKIIAGTDYVFRRKAFLLLKSKIQDNTFYTGKITSHDDEAKVAYVDAIISDNVDSEDVFKTVKYMIAQNKNNEPVIRKYINGV